MRNSGTFAVKLARKSEVNTTRFQLKSSFFFPRFPFHGRPIHCVAFRKFCTKYEFRKKTAERLIIFIGLVGIYHNVPKILQSLMPNPGKVHANLKLLSRYLCW